MDNDENLLDSFKSLRRTSFGTKSTQFPVNEGDVHYSESETLLPIPFDSKPIPLSLSTIIAYALPHFALAAMYLPTHVHVNMFYTDIMLVAPGQLAFCTALARSFDILVDPFFGWLSDNTRSTFGRRKPFIAAALPISAVCYVLLFVPPASMSSSQSAIWFGIFYALYLLVPLWLPLRALGPELTLQPEKRVLMYAWTEVFDRMGIITASVLPGIFMSLFDHDYRVTYAVLSLCISVAAVITFSIMLWVVKEPSHAPQDHSTPLIPGVRRAFRNYPFRILLLNQIVATISHTLSNVMFPFYLKYVLRPNEQEEEMWLSAVLLGYFGGGALSILVWEQCARKYDKLKVWLFALVLALPPTFFMFFLDQGDLVLFLVLTVFSGISHGGSGYLYNAIQADAIDYDELRTGERREGQFIAFWALIPKVVAIASSSVPLLVLQSAGYKANVQPQSDDVILVMKLLTTLSPWLLSTLALLVAFRFPIDLQLSLVISEEVQRRADSGRVDFQMESDPLSNGMLALPAKIVLESEVEDSVWWFLDHFSTSEVLALLHHEDSSQGFENAMIGLKQSIQLQMAGWSIAILGSVPMIVIGGDVARVLGISLLSGSVTVFVAEWLRYQAARGFKLDVFTKLHKHKHEYLQVVQVF